MLKSQTIKEIHLITNINNFHIKRKFRKKRKKKRKAKNTSIKKNINVINSKTQ